LQAGGHRDVEGAVKQVTLRMTRAAEEDATFREALADLAAERGGIYAKAFADMNSQAKECERVTTSAS
jgi:hypothetical protein